MMDRIGINNTIPLTTQLVLRGADGKIKKLWNENAFTRKMRKLSHALNLPVFAKLGDLRLPVFGYYADALNLHNIICVNGHIGANSLMSAQTPTTGSGTIGHFTNIAIGTGADATNGFGANASDLTLGQEIIGAAAPAGNRAAAAVTQTTITYTNDTTQLSYTFNFTGAWAITEEGIVDSNAAPIVTTITGAITSAATALTLANGSGFASGATAQISNEHLTLTTVAGTAVSGVIRGVMVNNVVGPATAHLANCGITNVSAYGNLLAHQVFSVINVVAGDSLAITHKYQT